MEINKNDTSFNEMSTELIVNEEALIQPGSPEKKKTIKE
jgi:hypothetical protein